MFVGDTTLGGLPLICLRVPRKQEEWSVERLKVFKWGKVPSPAPGKEEPLAHGYRLRTEGGRALGVLADSSSLAMKLANSILNRITRLTASRSRQVMILPDHSALVTSHLGTASSFRSPVQESCS